jgi:hypothetical protein
MGQLEILEAYRKARIALDELGELLERQSPSSLPQRSKLTRRKLCAEILRENPGLGIYEIMDELRKRGYSFIARNPLNSVRTLLYRSPEFAFKDGQFWLRKKVANADRRQKRAPAVGQV